MITGKLPYGEGSSGFSKKDPAYISARRINPEIPIWVDGALEKAVRNKARDRYEVISEFVYDLSNPKKEFLKNKKAPLIEKDPVKFWRGFSFFLLLTLFFVGLYLIA